LQKFKAYYTQLPSIYPIIQDPLEHTGAALPCPARAGPVVWPPSDGRYKCNLFLQQAAKKKTAQLLLLSPKPKLKVSKKRQATQMADPIGHSRATRGFLFSFL